MTLRRRAPMVLAMVAVSGLGVAGMKFLEAHAARNPQPLPVLGTVPAFHLIDQDGQPMSRDTLNGRVWVADFIFTRCAGQCPMMTARMGRLAALLDPRDAVTLVSFTVDPEHDTPEVLASYAKAQGAASASWRFVTGTPSAIVGLCRDGFHLAVADGEGTADEPISHSVRLVLVDRTGAIRGYYDATEDAQLQRLHRDLRRVLEERS